MKGPSEKVKVISEGASGKVLNKGASGKGMILTLTNKFTGFCDFDDRGKKERE